MRFLFILKKGTNITIQILVISIQRIHHEMRSSVTIPRSFSQKPLTVISVITLIATFVGLSQEIMYLRSCSIRYEIAKFLNHTCEEVRRYQPMCRRTIKISYSELAPYIFNNETGHVIGLFPGINSFCRHFVNALKA